MRRVSSVVLERVMVVNRPQGSPIGTATLSSSADHRTPLPRHFALPVHRNLVLHLNMTWQRLDDSSCHELTDDSRSEDAITIWIEKSE